MRNVIDLDPDWRFHRGDVPFEGANWGWLKAGTWYQGGSRSGMDDTAWRKVDLPHDFVVEGSFLPEDGENRKNHGIPEMWPGTVNEARDSHGSLPPDVAWYRKSFDVPASDEGRRIYVVFDGVFRDSRTFLNDYHVGDHLSGYTGFCYDVTDLIRYGERNVLAVRVDAREQEGWFYEGGGIYRHVRMIKTDPVHIRPGGDFIYTESVRADTKGDATADGESESRADTAHNGIIRNGAVRPGAARVFARYELRNRSDNAASGRVMLRILSPGGVEAASTEGRFEMTAWCEKDITLEADVEAPELWSPDSPTLYTAVVEIVVDGRLCDVLETSFGIRIAQFDSQRGFLLNGESIKLKGMCCHQDHAGVGSAVPDSVQEYRVRMLKEMGANAYRSAHHPPAPELLDICDRLGMLVLPENRLFSSVSENIDQLEAMVRIHRNHPSVICWSLGNEEMKTQSAPEGPRIARTLKNIVRKLDHTRPVTLAIPPFSWFTMRPTELEPVLPVADQLDVMGINYCDVHWLRFHELRPDTPLMITEDWSKSPTRGCYVKDDARCHLSFLAPRDEEAFYFEHAWQLVAEHPFISGIFIWTGFDYKGEPAPYEWPAVSSQFGVMDSCGFPKDNYYYYKTHWRNEPAVYLFPHWNHPDKIGQPVDVFCFTNCDEVELSLNGRSLGKKRAEKYHHIEWPAVEYQPGVLEAQGFTGGKPVAAFSVATTGAPYAIRLEPDRKSLMAGRGNRAKNSGEAGGRGDERDGGGSAGRDAVVVNVRVVDEAGLAVPTAENDILFEIDGAGIFLGAGNGDPSSHESDKEPRRRAFNGLCQIILAAGPSPGILKIIASARDLISDSVSIAVE